MQSTIKSKNELTVLFFIHSGGSQKFAKQHLMLLLGWGFQSQFFANQFGVFERWRLQFQLLHDFVDMSFVDGPKFGQNIAFCCFGHLCCLVFTRKNCLTLDGCSVSHFVFCSGERWLSSTDAQSRMMRFLALHYVAWYKSHGLMKIHRHRTTHTCATAAHHHRQRASVHQCCGGGIFSTQHIDFDGNGCVFGKFEIQFEVY